MARQSGGGAGREMSAVEAAYLAGLIDGEGSIGLHAYRQHGERRSHGFKPVLAISNTDMRIINCALKFTGTGYVTESRKDDGIHKPCYRWHVSPLNIGGIVRAVQPYLVSKRPQSVLLLEYLGFLEMGASRRVTDADFVRAIEIHREMRILNRRGDAEFLELNFEARAARRAENRCLETGCDRPRYLRGHGFCFQCWKKFKPVEIKTCAQCANQFEGFLEHGRFCTEKCMNQSYRERVTKPVARAIIAGRVRDCVGCGEPFTGGKLEKRYCSTECQYKHRRAILIAENLNAPIPESLKSAKKATEIERKKECVVCHSEFTTTYGKRIYCGPSCRGKAYIQRCMSKSQGV